MSVKSSEDAAVVLSGGGARGAYQVGVLSAVAEIFTQEQIPNPFNIYTGVSAGAINATHMASGNHHFAEATQQLVKLWSKIQSDQVFHSDAVNLGKIGFQWMSELSLGGITGTTPGKALLDTSPLKVLLEKNIAFNDIQKNIDNGFLKAVALTSIDYRSSEAVTFIQGQKNLPEWAKTRRHSELAILKSDHVMASAAIPLLFPPIGIDTRYFGDGCVRNANPCSPAINLGAKKLLIIGVKKDDSTEALFKDNALAQKPPSVARVINTLLNAVLLDGIEVDVERLDHLNKFVRSLPQEHHEKTKYKAVDFVWISPSQDIGSLAAKKANRLPRIIRYLLKGLGSLDEASEVVSYLLFDPLFCSDLIEVGYKDGKKQRENILKHFSPA